MEILTIIAAYIASVFVARWLNKIVYKKNYGGVVPMFWFLPIIIHIVLILIILTSDYEKSNNKYINWFKGNHWK